MNRNRVFRVTLGITVFLLALVVGVMVHTRLKARRPWLSSTSPNQKYTVELTGDKGRGGFLIYSEVKYNIIVDGDMVTSNRLLHYGDSMDISFELAYPENAWIDGNTLRFWSNRHRREDNLDVLLITNNTEKVIRFLRVKTWDMFFVFDIQPRSQVRLLFTHRSEGKGISVEGEFDDHSLIDYSTGFLENQSREQQKYCTTIDYDHVTIKSATEWGYDRRGNWDNPNIAPESSCAP
jgi:hypothetical protein